MHDAQKGGFMKEFGRNYFKQTIALLLSLSMVFLLAAPIEVNAAVNKALSVKCTFNGQNFADDGDDCSYNNNYSIVLADAAKKTKLSKLKLGIVTYIPKKVLKKNSAVVNTNLYLDLEQDNEYYGVTMGRYQISAVNDNGKINLYGWDQQTNKNKNISKFAKLKAGKGAYKDFYILTIKNMPVCNFIITQDGNVRLNAADSYTYRVGMTLCVENYKGSTNFYLDNISAVSGSKKLVNVDFNKKASVYVIYKDKTISKKKFSITKF